MSKGLGIAALVFAIIGIFIPFGYFLSGLSGLLCIFTYKNGFSFAISSIIINFINIIFLSPTLMLAVGANKNPMPENLLLFLLLFQIIPLIVFMVLYIKNKIK